MSAAKNFFLLSLLLAVMFAGYAAAQDKPHITPSPQPSSPPLIKNPPRAIVPETDFDFGAVRYADALSHDFPVLNMGPSDLIIEKVVPS